MREVLNKLAVMGGSVPVLITVTVTKRLLCNCTVCVLKEVSSYVCMFVNGREHFCCCSRGFQGKYALHFCFLFSTFTNKILCAASKNSGWGKWWLLVLYCYGCRCSQHLVQLRL